MAIPDGTPSTIGEKGVNVPVFERPPALVKFLDQTEDAIRLRLAKLRLFDRVFLLQRDWMTRVTMLMIILAVFWGAVGGFDAFGFQTQVVAYATSSDLHLSNQEIYSAITLHGLRELFGFAQQLEMALLGFLVVNALAVTPRHKWSYYTSVGLINASILLLEGPVYFLPFNDNYFAATGWYFLSPLGVLGQSSYAVSPLWFLGWLALCASVLLWTGWMVIHIREWFRRPGAVASIFRLPVFLWFVLGTLILLPFTYGPLVASTVWDLGTAYGGWAISALANQVIFWMFGHAIVYVLFLIPITALYLLLPILARRPVYSYRFAVAAAIMFVVLTPLLGIHHLYLTPLPGWSTWLTMVLSFAIILPSAITFFSLWMTVKGVPAEKWEWNAVALFALLSFAGAIFGGLTGPANATIPWDVSIHNSLFILSHFHAITILAIVAAGFALLYAVFPILTGRQWFSPRLAQVHFAMTVLGGVVLVLAFDQLGNLGVLRRSFILPIVPSITFYQMVLYGGIIVILLGQLVFVANGFLTVLRGELYSAAGLSFDEAVRKAAQSTCPRPRRRPFHDEPFVRKTPRPRREGVERVWVGAIIVILAVVIGAYTPSAFSVANGITSADPGPGTEFVVMHGFQYYWSVNESGPVEGTYDNAIVVNAGQTVTVNATVTGATQGLLIPFRSQAVVNVQVVPGSVSHASFQAPSVPGVYGVPDGEYNGPWFGQDVAALIVLPTSATGTSLAEFQSSGAEGNIYSPPVLPAASANLVGNGEGLFNFSVPGPTLSATVATTGGFVTFEWTVPLASIGINNYLVNVTSNDPSAQQAYVASRNYTLPYDFGIYSIHANGTLSVVGQAPLRVNSLVVETADLTPGVYLYGLIHPVAYEYDPAGDSGTWTGVQTGLVMGLWGVLWVSA